MTDVQNYYPPILDLLRRQQVQIRGEQIRQEQIRREQYRREQIETLNSPLPPITIDNVLEVIRSFVPSSQTQSQIAGALNTAQPMPTQLSVRNEYHPHEALLSDIIAQISAENYLRDCSAVQSLLHFVSENCFYNGNIRMYIRLPTELCAHYPIAVNAFSATLIIAAASDNADLLKNTVQFILLCNMKETVERSLDEVFTVLNIQHSSSSLS